MNTSKCTVSVFTEGSGGYAKTCVTARQGATSLMIADTRRHFAHAVKVLEAGKDLAKEQAQSRSYYEHDGKYTHDECRVTMWGQATVPCWDIENERSADVQLSINVVTEYTSAQDVLDLAWVLLTALGYRQMTDIERDQVATVQPSQGYSGHPSGKGSHHLEPLGNAPQSHETGQNSSAAHSQVSTIQDGDYCGAFDSRKKDEYRAAVGKTLAFDIAKIRGVLEDGVEKWELYSTLANGNAAQYPFTRVYGDNQYIAETIAALRAISQPGGKAVEGSWVGAFKIAVKGDKIYYNMQALKDKEVVF